MFIRKYLVWSLKIFFVYLKKRYLIFHDTWQLFYGTLSVHHFVTALLIFDLKVAYVYLQLQYKPGFFYILHQH